MDFLFGLCPDLFLELRRGSYFSESKGKAFVQENPTPCLWIVLNRMPMYLFLSFLALSLSFIAFLLSLSILFPLDCSNLLSTVQCLFLAIDPFGLFGILHVFLSNSFHLIGFVLFYLFVDTIVLKWLELFFFLLLYL